MAGRSFPRCLELSPRAPGLQDGSIVGSCAARHDAGDSTKSPGAQLWIKGFRGLLEMIEGSINLAQIEERLPQVVMNRMDVAC